MECFLISHLLEGAEEASQLLDNISQLAQYGFLLRSGFHRSDDKARTLHNIYMFMKSEIQQNPLLPAKELCVRYFAHDKHLPVRDLVKPFEVLHQYVNLFHHRSDRVSFSNLLRNLLLSVPFRKTILVLYVSFLYVPFPLLKSHTFRHPSLNRTALWQKLSPRVIPQLSIRCISTQLESTPFH